MKASVPGSDVDRSVLADAFRRELGAYGEGCRRGLFERIDQPVRDGEELLARGQRGGYRVGEWRPVEREVLTERARVCEPVEAIAAFDRVDVDKLVAHAAVGDGAELNDFEQVEGHATLLPKGRCRGCGAAGNAESEEACPRLRYRTHPKVPLS